MFDPIVIVAGLVPVAFVAGLVVEDRFLLVAQAKLWVKEKAEAVRSKVEDVVKR